MLKKGVTLLEMVVVIAVIAILTAVMMPTSQENLNLEKLQAEVKSVAQKITQLTIDARVMGRTIKVTCDSQGIMAYSYAVNQSRDYVSAASKATGAIAETIEIESAANSMTLAGICSAPKVFYITSEGYIFSAAGVAGISNIEFRVRGYGARLDISGAGYPNIFIGPLLPLGLITNEI